MLAHTVETEPDQKTGETTPPSTWMPSAAPASGLIDPGLMLLPYIEFSRAMLRAHHNFHAMMEANRTLADALRDIVRRQQDLALEIAEQAWSGADALKSGAPANDRQTMFQRAADAVREIGQAVIDAQLEAIETLQGETEAGGPSEAGRGQKSGARRRAGVRG